MDWVASQGMFVIRTLAWSSAASWCSLTARRIAQYLHPAYPTPCLAAQLTRLPALLRVVVLQARLLEARVVSLESDLAEASREANTLTRQLQQALQVRARA